MEDMNGKPINIGDGIVYARMEGQSTVLGAGRVIGTNDVKVVMDGVNSKILIQPTWLTWRGERPLAVWLSRPLAVVIIEKASAIEWGFDARHAHSHVWYADAECTSCVPQSIELAREAIRARSNG